MGCCLCIRRLTHINLSLSSVPEIRVSLGDGTRGIAGICCNYHLLRIIIMCQILNSDKAYTFYYLAIQLPHGVSVTSTCLHFTGGVQTLRG